MTREERRILLLLVAREGAIAYEDREGVFVPAIPLKSCPGNWPSMKIAASMVSNANSLGLDMDVVASILAQAHMRYITEIPSLLMCWNVPLEEGELPLPCGEQTKEN